MSAAGGALALTFVLGLFAGALTYSMIQAHADNERTQAVIDQQHQCASAGLCRAADGGDINAEIAHNEALLADHRAVERIGTIVAVLLWIGVAAGLCVFGVRLARAPATAVPRAESSPLPNWTTISVAAREQWGSGLLPQTALSTEGSFCSRCNEPTMPKAKFCTHCGSTLATCAACGADRDLSDRFCRACGAKARSDDELVPQAG